MFCFTIADFKLCYKKHHRALITVFWLLGLLSGCYFGFKTPVPIISLMRTSFFERVSIVWRLCALLLPILLSFAALRLSASLLLLPVFLKAYSLGYCLCCINFAFGNAGWLMCMLCLCSDVCGAVLFLYMAFHHVMFEERRNLQKVICCLVIVTALGLFDYFIVSPFLVTLLNY